MHFRDLVISTDGSLATLTFPGPSTYYLNEDNVFTTLGGLLRLQRDPSIHAICLCGQAESFVAGADPQLFLKCLLANDLERILRFTRTTHALLAEIEGSATPVTAWVQGPAIGGGLELALACHRIVAAPGAKFSFPETGLGIYPGMGGTQRLPRRIGTGLAKWMIYTGAVVPANQALEIGLIDAVHPTAVDAREALSTLGGPKNGSPTATQRFQALEDLFGNHDLATLADPSLAPPTEPQAIRALVQMRSKAPLALQIVERIMDRGIGLSLAAGIEEEFSHLHEIFATEDARRGLSSLGKQRPKFVGR